MAQAFIQRIATAVPDNEVHGEFVAFVDRLLREDRARELFRRMAERSEIDRRFSVLQASPPYGPGSINAHELYRLGYFPATAERMKLFETLAPALLRKALDRLALSEEERSRVRHVIVTCCTGHYAPGLDFEIIRHLGLRNDTSRTMIGFMGCYAAINGLRQAHHIVKSAPGEDVLLVNLELCTLHLQDSQNIAEVLSFLVFADGCAVSLISSGRSGLSIDSFRSIITAGTDDLITWRIGNEGFLMHLSGQVPSEVGKLLSQEAAELAPSGDIALWAVHPGGRTVLDAVAEGLALPPEALSASRHVLRSFGNMSSATVMFVLAELMASAQSGQKGVAMSFGPGLTAEMMEFHAV